MSRTCLVGAIIFLLLIITIDSAAIVSDVQVAGGYLYEIWTDHTTIYDLTVDPPEEVGVITYPESTIPINAEIYKHYLCLYHYQDDYDNGIFLYDISLLSTAVLVDNITLPDGLIQGGFLASGEALFGERGQFSPYAHYLVFTGTEYVDYPMQGTYKFHLYKYDMTENNTQQISMTFYEPTKEECIEHYEYYFRHSQFIWFNHSYTIIQDDKVTFRIPTDELLNLDRICLFPSYTSTGTMGGPLLEWNKKIVGHWLYHYPLSSGMKIIEFFDTSGTEEAVSDYTCAYMNTHNGELGTLNSDNVDYDVQKFLIHNSEIYLSSYYTKSIPHTNLNKDDWGIWLECQDYWNFYDIPETGRPYGIAAANGTLYVAGKDKRYDFPLAKPDPELPDGEIYSVKMNGNVFNVSGKAWDSEGIKQVTVRLDYAYQFLANRVQEDCEPATSTGGHDRP